MTYKDEEAANARYGNNGWTVAENLVLYRLDMCEENICKVRDDLEKLINTRAADVENSREQRTEQYTNLQKSLQDIKDTFSEEALKRVESGKLRAEREAALKIEQVKLEGRLQRIEKIVYGIVGTTGLIVLKTILENIF